MASWKTANYLPRWCSTKIVLHCAYLIYEVIWDTLAVKMKQPSKSEKFQKRTVRLAESFIKALGEDIKREGLRDTPSRVSRSCRDIFSGYFEQIPKITVFGNTEFTKAKIIIDEGYFYSTCEHHLLPFFGHYWFAYVPDKKIIGLSKISRVIKHFSSKLQTQEHLTKEVIDVLGEALRPKGIACVLRARHLCKEARGIRQYGGKMTTSDLRGVLNKGAMKSDFLALIGKSATEI